MNPLEEGVIPLAGPGFVSRSSESYGPGEFKDVENLVLTPSGTLKKRRQVNSWFHTPTEGAHRFIGSINEWAIFTRYHDLAHATLNQSYLYFCAEFTQVKQRFVDNLATFKTNLDAAAPLPAGPVYPATAKGFLFEGFFRYGSRDYAIVHNIGFDNATSSVSKHGSSLSVVSAPHPSNDDYDIEINFDSFGTAIMSQIQEVLGGDVEWRLRPFVSNYIIHKERLFIAVGDTIYWSKATDPQKFATADDGGFIRYPGGRIIKKILALGDLIYVIFDNSINVLSYNTGPNQDLQNREISNVVGGEDGVIYGDTLYLVKYDAIYAVRGMNVSKAMDLELNYPISFDIIDEGLNITEITMLRLYAYQMKAEIFDGHLYIIVRKIYTVDDESHLYAIRYVKDDSHSPFMVNLENGFVTRLSFHPSGPGGSKNPSDMMFVAYEDSYNQSKMVFVSSWLDGTTYVYNQGTRQPWVTSTSSVLERNSGMDNYITIEGEMQAFYYTPIPVKLHVSQYSPEGLKYIIKKFRSLELQMDAPKLAAATGFPEEPELELVVTAGRQNSAGSGVLIKQPLSGTLDLVPQGDITVSEQNVSSFRFGVNQRASAIDIVIQSTTSVRNRFANVTGMLGDISSVLRSSLMEIVDIRTLWTPTRRGPNNDPNSLS